MTQKKIPYDRLLAQERLIVDVIGSLWEELERSKVRKTDLADRLGVSRAYVTQALNGGRNLSLRTLADFAWALDCKIRVGLASSDFDESRVVIRTNAEQPARGESVTVPTNAARRVRTSYAHAA